MDQKERLALAQWILERNLSWIAASEVKVGVIVTIDMAMLGGLAAAFGNLKIAERTACIYLWALGGAVPIVIAIFCSGMSLLPRMDGPERSFLFFGRIAQLERVNYSEKFRQVSDEEFLDDSTSQIHRNAEIAASKFSWVRRSMCWSFFSVIPWIISIAILMKR
jgi:hypothetical protein